jgi:hypothetical protein
MPKIENNTIHQNHARYGSAVHCTLSIPKIIGNTIENNAMYNSYPLPLYFGSVEGAITLDMGENFLIEGNVVKGNTAGTGAGINVKTNYAGRIQNNLILNNTAYDPTAFGGMGGGIYCLVPPAATDNLYIVNNTIVGNSATYAGMPKPLDEQGGGIAISLPPPLPTPSPPPQGKLTIANNIIAFNSSGLYQTATTPMLSFTLVNNDVFNAGANYRDISPGTGDMSTDPLFLDRTSGDFHLVFDSPCIDAGDNGPVSLIAYDFDGNPRIMDGKMSGFPTVDMGATEYASALDINGDGVVDIGDIISVLQLLSHQAPSVLVGSGVDSNGDGKLGMEEALYILQVIAKIR